MKGSMKCTTELIIFIMINNIFNLRNIELAGGTGDDAEIIVNGYASDHYALVATYEIK